MKNSTIIAVAVALVLGFGGGYLAFHQDGLVSAISTTAGNTFSSAKIAEIGVTPLTAGQNGTSTSILNTDSTDRVVESSFIACSGVGTSLSANAGSGIANWNVKMATSSTAAPAALSSVNYISDMNIATATTDAFVASSTATAPNPVGRLWASGSYLTIFFNATNTATCVAGVHYLAS